VDLQELKTKLEENINQYAPVPPKILMNRFCFLSDSSQFTQAFADRRYFPFFYYLGKLLKPTKLLEIGFGLGFVSGCFLQGCKTVNEFTAYQNNDEQFYSYRLGRRNILSVYKNKFSFVDSFKDLGEFDMVLVSGDNTLDKYRIELDMGWKCLTHGGLMVIDRVVYGTEVAKKVLPDFCKIINREALIVDSRYGTAIIEK
jgi:predicted O-methyltransferase YrrM